MSPRRGRPSQRVLVVRRSLALLLVVVTCAAVYLAVAGMTSDRAAGRLVRTRARNRTTRSTSTGSAAAKPEVYAHTTAVRPDVATDLRRVYVPSGRADTVTAIDPSTKSIVGHFSTGLGSTPQHIVPSFDLKTLWVLDNKSDRVVPIDAHTGAIGAPIAVNDPYNLYFTPDGRSAIVVAELHARLDFRDPHTFALQQS